MIEKNPFLTVIVPAYNAEKTVVRALDSIFANKLENIEVIVINDGSVDNTEEIVRNYSVKNKRVKLITQENEGVAKARNRALKLAKGEYIYFLDADDELYKGAIDFIKTNVEKFKLDYFGFFSKIGDKTEKPKSMSFIDKSMKGSRHLRLENIDIAGPWRFVAKKSIYEQNNIQFIEEPIHEDDIPAFLTLLSAKRAIQSDMTLHVQHVQENSLSHRIDITTSINCCLNNAAILLGMQFSPIKKRLCRRFAFTEIHIALTKLYASDEKKYKAVAKNLLKDYKLGLAKPLLIKRANQNSSKILQKAISALLRVL